MVLTWGAPAPQTPRFGGLGHQAERAPPRFSLEKGQAHPASEITIFLFRFTPSNFLFRFPHYLGELRAPRAPEVRLGAGLLARSRGEDLMGQAAFLNSYF